MKDPATELMEENSDSLMEDSLVESEEEAEGGIEIGPDLHVGIGRGDYHGK